MKAFIALLILAIAGMLVYQWMQLAPQPVNPVTDTKVPVADDSTADMAAAETTAADMAPADMAAADQTSPTAARQLDLLQQLAERNELFRWSLDIEQQNKGGRLYERVSADHFQTTFEAEPRLLPVQSQDNYLGWVNTFYDGNFWSNGWRDKAQTVDEAGQRAETVRYLNVLGRVIAAEWSKDNGVRTIDSGQVRQWGNALIATVESDADGAASLAMLQKIAREVADQLAHGG